MKFNQFISEVGEWAEYNFGEATSAAGALAPCVGMAEEIGELLDSEDTYASAKHFNDLDILVDAAHDIRDAIGDITVFCAHMLYRLQKMYGFEYPLSWPDEQERVTLADSRSLSSCYGALCHAVLKSHQGIREFADPERRESALISTTANFLGALETYSRGHLQTVRSCAIHTWLVTVKGRDWKANPDTAEKAAVAAVEEVKAEDPFA